MSERPKSQICISWQQLIVHNQAMEEPHTAVAPFSKLIGVVYMAYMWRLMLDYILAVPMSNANTWDWQKICSWCMTYGLRYYGLTITYIAICQCMTVWLIDVGHQCAIV